MTRCRTTFRSLPALASFLTLVFVPAGALHAEAPAGLRKITIVEGITEYRLDNGLRILLFPDASSPRLTVNCTIFVGSRHEGYGETGMAHLLEHMLFKGTPSHRDIPRALRDRGADFNGTTNDDRTNYYETFNANEANLEFAIRLEADRLVNSFVKREDLASEMTVVRSEFESGENNPQNILNQRMAAVAFEWHNYGKSTIGNRSDIERVPIEKLQAFYHKHYRPDNAMIVVAGNFKADKALTLIAKYFGALKKPERQLDNTYTEEPPQDGERTVVLRRVGRIGAIGAVYHIPAAAHPDCAPLDVLSRILTAQPSGRLYQALVERGKKATAVIASAEALHDPGLFVILATVDDRATVESARDTLLRTLDEVRAGPITQEEVTRALIQLRKTWELGMAHSNRIGLVLSEWAARGDWRLMFLHRDRVAKVKPGDVARVARQYLSTNNRTVGLYIPTQTPERAAIPTAPDIARLLKDYQSAETIAEGEAFDPTVENIQKRVRLGRLSSGVKVALLPHKTRNSVVTIDLALHYGNAESLKGHASASEFLGSLMRRGTKKHTRQQLVDELNRLEARLVSGGDRGSVTFAIECKRKTLPDVLNLLTEILREPTFPENEFSIFKRQARTQREQGKTEPAILASLALQRRLAPYPADDVRYTPTLDESLARLETVTVEEVRKLYTEQLSGQHGEFVVVGDFDPELVLKKMDDALKDWKAAIPYRRIEQHAAENVKPERIAIETPDKANAVYFAGLMMPLRDIDPDNAPLELANFILGGEGLSSRLGERVRQKEGLSYEVESSYSADAQDKAALFHVAAICNPKNIDRLDKAILEELERMHQKGITEAELREAKKAFLASLKQMRGTDAALAGILQSELYVGRSIAYYGDLEHKIESLTVEEVNSAFRKRVDPKKLVIIQAGDFKKK